MKRNRNAIVINHIPYQSKGGEMKKSSLMGLIVGFLAIFAFLTLAVQQADNAEQFVCVNGQEVLQPYGNIYAVTSKYCRGNISNAVVYVMEANGIQTTELGSLTVGRLINVPETK
jgi:hypothetical protein